MQDLNFSIFELLNGLSHYDFIAQISPILADFPILFLPVFLSWMWIYFALTHGNSDKKKGLLHIFYACVVWIIFSYIIKQFVDIERPDMYLESTKNMILNRIPEKSFPSDHATVSFAFLTALFYGWYKKVGYVFLPFVLMMNISRIIVGVHWPLDIFVWTLLWILSASIFFLYFKELKLVKQLNSFIIQVVSYIKL